MLTDRLGLFFFRLLIGVFRILPDGIIRQIAQFIAFLFEHIIGYRKKVIVSNLKIVFPEKKEEEIKAITHQVYISLADNLTETIKSFSRSKEDLMQHMTITNPEFLDKYFKEDQSIILLGGHFYSWELAVQGTPLFVKYPVYGVYKPLSNALVGDALYSLRNRFGSIPIAMNQTLRVIIKNKKTPSLYVFIADQSPSNVKSAHWLSFFGRPTGFLQGADKIARLTGYPVLYYTIKRTKRGFYTLTFSELCPTPKTKKEGEITYLFAQKLSQNILEDPYGWLWSHKRWKRQMPKNAKILTGGSPCPPSDN
ncbi:MAG TPA: lauroyl acyltransferase [Saprospiraceae bacterium]|nr:lauroyl acyltransferase [Saprospiraceae bacterium]